MKIQELINFIKNRTVSYTQKFFRRSEYIQDMQDMKNLEVLYTHMETFGKYKNYFNNQEIAIIATGPSLKNYSPIPNVINIGVNKAFKCEKINLSYLFMQDYGAVKSYINELDNKKYQNIEKFFGILPYPNYYGNKLLSSKQLIISESIRLRLNAHKYFTYTKYPLFPLNFTVDIDKNYISDCGTIALSAMQFALFTNPKKIYLVGCDCSSGYFDGKIGSNCNRFASRWEKLKEFAKVFYPETEIISVNPVGLKGLFTDLYQE